MCKAGGGGGGGGGGGSDSPISIVPHLKLTSVLTLKCARCLDTFLKFYILPRQ